MEFKDYYQVLGIQRDASPEEIKRAYRKLARKYHPDVSKEPRAEERFKEINEANEVLSDLEKRAAYDQLGQDWRAGQDFSPPPGWQQASGGGAHRPFTAREAVQFSDFFESLFGGLGAGRGFRPGTGDFAARAGRQDTHARVAIDLEDAFRGATRQLSLRMPEYDSSGNFVMREKVLSVRIPAGIRPGQQIRLVGQGERGSDGVAGDLYLEVEFNPHPFYRLEGRDLYLDLPVTPWEAALGRSIQVPTPTGRLEVSIPPNSAGGRQLRLRGKGLPGQPPGDMYVVLQIALPPASSDKAREIYRTMERELHFDPRRSMGGQA